MKEEFHFYDKQVVIKTNKGICQDCEELIKSNLFRRVLQKYLKYLKKKDSPILGIFKDVPESIQEEFILSSLLLLCKDSSIEEVSKANSQFELLLRDSYLFHQFVERLYDFWRDYERFFIKYDFEEDEGIKSYKKPYRAFNQTIEQLNHLVRKTYRNICENITGDHPRIYRQVPAGCQVGLITTSIDYQLPLVYKKVVRDIPLITQILIEPPLIIDPLMNKRAGQFEKVDTNPLREVKINPRDWLCFPAKVGDLIIYFYFYNKFIGLGTALANLFELAHGEELLRMPEAIYLYGVPPASLQRYGNLPTVFHDDEKNNLLVAALPALNEMGYFGYIKKMILTLHNTVIMKRGRLPIHGAMVRICLKNGKSANLVIAGDTGTGKSESLEAFRVLAKEYIRDMTIIYDDMGSLEITEEGEIKGYGTEVGAFVRLDDLQPGYAFGVIDRSIIMSPHKINARAVIPITTLQEILKGYKVDYFLYANNYEEVDDNHPIFEELFSAEEAIAVFREGARLAKGTTTEKGLVRSYFANIFGPIQYKELHEGIALRYFNKLFENKVKVGQLRTRLGIPGYERKGPEKAAQELIKIIKGDNLW
ncbi:MAG: phosphoenolpyruvate carboxykinase [Candidatus Nealsonbacteria bacterium]|nr:MAG: phosphoenolpyruvate carboxykinase [Candidatus Nealsonbacteria bacterium]